MAEKRTTPAPPPRPAKGGGRRAPRTIEQILREKAAAKKAAQTTKGSKTNKGTGKGPKAPQRKEEAPVYLVRSEVINLPSGKKVRADRYRYPKGHPKAGQFVRAEVALKGRLIREVVRRGGKVDKLKRTSKAKAKEVRKAGTGRSFTSFMRDYSVAEAAEAAFDRGRSVFVRMGGKVYQVPASKEPDLRAFLADIKSRMISTERKTAPKGTQRPYGALIEVSTGTTGTLIDMDRLDFMQGEVREEFGAWMDQRQEAESLAEYLSRSAGQYLGASVDPDDVLRAWENEQDEEPEEFEEL